MAQRTLVVIQMKVGKGALMRQRVQIILAIERDFQTDGLETSLLTASAQRQSQTDTGTPRCACRLISIDQLWRNERHAEAIMNRRDAHAASGTLSAPHAFLIREGERADGGGGGAEATKERKAEVWPHFSASMFGHCSEEGERRCQEGSRGRAMAEI